MAGRVKRAPMAKRAKKQVMVPAAPPPPPPFLFFCRGSIRATEPAVLGVVVTIPLQQLQSRTGIHDAVLRSVLHRPHPSPSSSSSSSSHDTSAAPLRLLIHVEHINIHTESARQTNHTGDVQLRATIAGVLAHVEHGLFVGVTKSTTYADTMVVQLQQKGVDGENLCSSNNNNDNDGENVGTSALLVTARCLESEQVVIGQTVLLASEPGTLRCLAIRPPRPAPGPFKLTVEDDKAVIQADWPIKRFDGNAHAADPPREPGEQRDNGHEVA